MKFYDIMGNELAVGDKCVRSNMVDRSVRMDVVEITELHQKDNQKVRTISYTKKGSSMWDVTKEDSTWVKGNHTPTRSGKLGTFMMTGKLCKLTGIEDKLTAMGL